MSKFIAVFLITLISFNLFAKTAFIVPGYLSKHDSKGYPGLIATLENLDYEVEFIKLKWKGNNFKNYIQQIDKQLSHSKAKRDEENILVSSSLGGFLVASQIKKFPVSEIFLVSPAPLFEEYRKSLRKLAWPNLAANVFYKNAKGYYQEDFCNYVNDNQIKVHLFFGKKETKDNRLFAYGLNQCLPDSEITRIENGKHGIRHKRNNQFIRNYLENILF